MRLFSFRKLFCDFIYMIPENYLGLDGFLNVLLQSNDLFAVVQKYDPANE